MHLGLLPREVGVGERPKKFLKSFNPKNCKIYCISIAAFQNVIIPLIITDTQAFHQARGPASEYRVLRSSDVGAASGRATEFTEVSQNSGDRAARESSSNTKATTGKHRHPTATKGSGRPTSTRHPSRFWSTAKSGVPIPGAKKISFLITGMCCGPGSFVSHTGKRNLRNGQFTEQTDVDKERNQCSLGGGGGAASPLAL